MERSVHSWGSTAPLLELGGWRCRTRKPRFLQLPSPQPRGPKSRSWPTEQVTPTALVSCRKSRLSPAGSFGGAGGDCGVQRRWRLGEVGANLLSRPGLPPPQQKCADSLSGGTLMGPNTAPRTFQRRSAVIAGLFSSAHILGVAKGWHIWRRQGWRWGGWRVGLASGSWELSA